MMYSVHLFMCVRDFVLSTPCTHVHIRHTIYICTCVSVCTQTNVQYTGSFDTGWRRLIGSPKLQIIFHKRATKYRALLRKLTSKDKGSYESSPPCRCVGYAVYICLCTVYIHLFMCVRDYGVATSSMLLKNYKSLLQNMVSFVGLFCKRDL